jgi:MFS family permease
LNFLGYKRGAFVTAFQLFVCLGTLAAYGVNAVFSESGEWRWMLFAVSFPAALQLAGFFFFPESPRWLSARGKKEELPQERLFSKRFSLLIAIAVVLTSFQQFSGINAIVYFMPKIFNGAGLAPGDAIFATLIVGVVNVFSTLISIFLIDRLGRLKLLLISQMGVVLSLLALVFSSASIFAYIFLYSLGLGPIVWVLISEIFPTSVRAKALVLATFVSWMSNYLVVLSFPSLLFSIGNSWTFSLYALLSLAAFVFYKKFIPETKGKSLEELEKILVRHGN